MKKLLICAIGLALLLSVSACGGSKAPATDETATATPAVSSTPAASGDVKEVKITAVKFKYDQKEYKFAVGDKVKFTLENKDGSHGLGIAELGVDLNADHPTSDVITLDKAGTYEIKCTVMCGSGHSNMKSTLVVE